MFYDPYDYTYILGFINQIITRGYTHIHYIVISPQSTQQLTAVNQG